MLILSSGDKRSLCLIPWRAAVSWTETTEQDGGGGAWKEVAGSFTEELPNVQTSRVFCNGLFVERWYICVLQ